MAIHGIIYMIIRLFLLYHAKPSLPILCGKCFVSKISCGSSAEGCARRRQVRANMKIWINMETAGKPIENDRTPSKKHEKTGGNKPKSSQTGMTGQAKRTPKSMKPLYLQVALADHLHGTRVAQGAKAFATALKAKGVHRRRGALDISS